MRNPPRPGAIGSKGKPTRSPKSPAPTRVWNNVAAEQRQTDLATKAAQRTYKDSRPTRLTKNRVAK